MNYLRSVSRALRRKMPKLGIKLKMTQIVPVNSCDWNSKRFWEAPTTYLRIRMSILFRKSASTLENNKTTSVLMSS